MMAEECPYCWTRKSPHLPAECLANLLNMRENQLFMLGVTERMIDKLSRIVATEKEA